MKEHATGYWVAALFSVVAISATLLACAAELPEPESEAAQLYVRYCSADGCHDPIPPKAATARVWKIQYDRMIDIMRRGGFALPSAAEERLILDYLNRHAEATSQ